MTKDKSDTSLLNIKNSPSHSKPTISTENFCKMCLQLPSFKIAHVLQKNFKVGNPITHSTPELYQIFLFKIVISYNKCQRI